MKKFVSAALVTCLLGQPVAANQLAFDDQWREQGFNLFSSNAYGLNGTALSIGSEGTVSLLWRALPDGLRSASAASWQWAVAQSVPATNLALKGGDDRNIALYFVFTTPAKAESLNPNRAARLLRDDDTKALVYVWGGESGRGTVQQSPYHPGLRTLIRRGAGTGQHSEQVDLVADFRRAFGTDPGVLVGVGVTADSDDTDTVIRAQLSNLQLK